MKALQELKRASQAKVVYGLLRGNNQVAARDSLIRKFYDLLDEKDVEEAEIVRQLYGPKATPSLARYRTLKVRLKNILIEAFLRGKATEPDYTTYDLAYKNGFKHLEVSRLLIGQSAHHAARELLSKTWYAVKDYEIIQLNFGLTDTLSSLNLGLAYNEELFLKYSQLAEYYGQAMIDTYKVLQAYRYVRNAFYAQRSTSVEIGQLANKYVEQYRSIVEKYPKVSRVQGAFAIMEITAHMEQGRYEHAIDAASRGMELLAKCKGTGGGVMSVLALVRVECTIKSDNFELGKRQIELARGAVKQSVINQIKLMEYAVLLGLRTGQYDFAYLEFVGVSHRQLKRYLRQNHIEYWLILEAYVNFLVVAGCIQIKDEWSSLRRFRVNKFVNDVPAYSRIKKGMNIQILILQVLFLIVLKKFDQAIDRTDALAAYSSRYLRDNENLRNSCFFKILRITIQENFVREAVRRKAQKTFERMLSTRNSLAVNDTEIVPYEVLWEILLDHLQAPRKKSNSAKLA
ncbi:MAG: hypothetical protein AAFZ52_02305 [Bacteroidota bacterium]